MNKLKIHERNSRAVISDFFLLRGAKIRILNIMISSVALFVSAGSVKSEVTVRSFDEGLNHWDITFDPITFTATGNTGNFAWFVFKDFYVENSMARGFLVSGTLELTVDGVTTSYTPVAANGTYDVVFGVLDQNDLIVNIASTGPEIASGVEVVASTDGIRFVSSDVPRIAEGPFEVAFWDNGSTGEVQTEVVSVPKVQPAITSFTQQESGSWELGIQGDYRTGYEFRSTPLLDFSSGSLVESLSPVGLDAPGIVAGSNEAILITNIKGEGTVLLSLEGSPADFVRAQETEISSLLVENFDLAAALPAGWSSTGPSNGTDWEVGSPTVAGPPAAQSEPNCAGTNIAGYHTENTDVSLVSPSFKIPGNAGAVLSFSQFIETDLLGAEDDDAGSVRILDADNEDLPILELGVDRIEGEGGEWTRESLTLPMPDVGGKNIKIEFRFVSNAGTTVETDVWSGFYIDDVLVEIAL